MTSTEPMREAGRKVLASAPLGSDLAVLAGAVFEAMQGVPAAAPAPVAASVKKTVGHNVEVRQGPWTAYAQPFNASRLAAGETRSDTIAYTEGKLPSGVVLSHKWPARESGAGPWGVNALDYGNYWGTVALTPIPPKRIKDIATLAQTINLAIGGETTGFNVLFDAILTEKPADFTVRTEIDWMVHASDSGRRYVSTLPVKGKWTDAAGFKWTFHHDVSRKDMKVLYVLGEAGKPLLVGTLEIKAVFAALQAAGLLTGEEFYNGHLVGTEPVKGAGFLVFNDTAVIYN